ncbi:hypothetical protein [Thioalkalivibrio sp. ALJT]|uniref:hypothetical protein n=1 Tax=Thioalkalivibrio sp. ALJT TaxID=1158146 RepID=UPI00047759D6|nr:hypothetical protein [Thioalkalivibrio sp. ALJT]
MRVFVRGVDRAPLWLFALLVASIGLAPWVPEPYVAEKLRGLLAGEFDWPRDLFSLMVHAAPWLLMAFKLYRNSLSDGRAP